MRRFLPLAVLALVAANMYIYQGVVAPAKLTVTLLNVGQGDAILVEGPTGTTLLVDGGRGRAVLRELGETLPFWERGIDAVVATHPDADHIGGLPDVFDAYDVRHLFESGVANDTGPTIALETAANAEQGLLRHIARRGTRLNLGGGAYADILYPDRDVTKVETNDGSIVMRIAYGATSFMLTGDLASDIEDWLITLDPEDGLLDVDVLKAGHHGSKYSTSDAWLQALTPAVVAISVGKDNSYGHPTPETLARALNASAIVYRTDTDGRLVFTSDGKRVTKR